MMRGRCYPTYFILGLLRFGPRRFLAKHRTCWHCKDAYFRLVEEL
jgi:hypothetical protein